MRFLAFDIGSSYTKLAVLDGEAATAQIVDYRPTRPRLEAPRGHFAIDPDALFRDVREMLDARLDIEPDMGGVFFSTQMHGFILTRDDRAITPYVTWQDARADIPKDGETDASRLGRLLGHETILKMGTRFKAGLAACSLFSMLRDAPIPLEGARFNTLGSFMISRLSDERQNACHLTDAASTGFAVAETGRWNPDVIGAVGVSALAFPDIVPETRPLGRYRGVPLFAAIGDHQASVYGSGEGIERAVSLTIGTATIICAVAPGYVHADMEVRPFFDNQCLMTITRQPGGRVLDVVVELVRDCARLSTGSEPDLQSVWSALLAQLKSDTDALAVSPDFFIGTGEGAIRNVSGTNLTAENLFSGALNALAEAYAGPIARLRAHNPAIDRLILCGGRLAKLPALHARLTDRTGLPACDAPYRDSALYGLLRIARRV